MLRVAAARRDHPPSMDRQLQHSNAMRQTRLHLVSSQPLSELHMIASVRTLIAWLVAGWCRLGARRCAFDRSFLLVQFCAIRIAALIHATRALVCGIPMLDTQQNTSIARTSMRLLHTCMRDTCYARAELQIRCRSPQLIMSY